MITCHINKLTREIILISPYDGDRFDGVFSTIELDESLVDEMLDIQDKYRRLQRKLQTLLEKDAK